MIKLLKKLMRDRRGNALVIAGASLPLVIGAAGLATDTIQWALWKRQLQRAADSAALAGVYAEAQSKSVDTTCASYSSSTYASPVSWDVKKNNKAWPNTTCVVSNPPTSGAYTGDTKAVQVSLSVAQLLPFSGFFVSTAPTIKATAVATLQDSGKYCLVALNNTSTPGITIGGSASATLGCGAISNSTAATNSVDPNGASYTFAATPVASVGGMPSSINGATDLQPFHIAEPDPFAGQYPTTIPSSMSCNNFNSHTYTTNNAGNGNGNGNNNNAQTHLTAGCYNSFNPSGGGTYYMDSGVYYMNSTDFSPGGGVTIIGSGVTIILTGSNPGAINLDGNQTVQLTAPTSGTYAKMLIIQASNATTNNLNKFNGTSTSYFDGAIYIPNGQVQLNGSTGASTQCAMLVAWTVDISGNANLQNSLTRPDGSACQANNTVTAKVVRLVE